MKERVTHHTMSRQSSRQARDRIGDSTERPQRSSPSATTSPAGSNAQLPTPASPRAQVSTVRPSFSFAKAAAGKKDALGGNEEEKADDTVAEVADKVAEVSL